MDGAEFAAAGYCDATTRTWSGKLVIGGQVIEREAGGVFRLLTKLDGAYRASAAPAAADPEAGAAGGKV